MFFECVFCFVLGAAVSVFSVYLGMRIREKAPTPEPVSEEAARTEQKLSEQWNEMLNFTGEVKR